MLEKRKGEAIDLAFFSFSETLAQNNQYLRKPQNDPFAQNCGAILDSTTPTVEVAIAPSSVMPRPVI